MNTKKTKAIIAIILIITLTFADILFFGINVVSYAVELVSTTNHNNVQFMAYFITKEGEKVTSLSDKIDTKDLKMYIEVGVENEGYFNGNIQVENSNFTLNSESIGNGISKIEGNTITLNQVTAGEKIEAEVGITPIKEDQYNLEMLNTSSKISLEGTYVSSSKKDITIKADRELKLVLENPYTSEAENVEVGSKVVTNKEYNINGEEKRVVQVLVTNVLKGNGYPIKSTVFEIEAPKEVEEVKVSSRGTKATNGANSISEKEYKLDKETNMLTINISNSEKDGIVTWNKSGEDNILVTYVLDKEEDIKGTELNIKTTVTLYDENSTQYIGKTTAKIEAEIDGAVEISGEERETPIYKGNMYLGEETEFENATKLDIRYEKISDNIKIEEGTSKLIEENAETEANTTYKSTKISKAEIDRILGEKGQITIKNEKGTTIATIDSSLKADANGMIEVKYAGGEKALTIEIENAEGEGTIEFQHTMTILVSDYSREEVRNISELKIISSLNATTTNIVKEEVSEKTVSNEQEEKAEEETAKEAEENVIETEKKSNIENRIKIADTTTYARMTSNTKVLSTLQTNSNVVFNVVLKSDDIKYDLYKNPTIQVTFPSNISELKINSINQLYCEEMKIESAKMKTNENGNKVIEVKFKGEQTSYTNTISEGIILSFNVDITFDKLTPGQETAIKLVYTNENGIEEQYSEQLPLTLQSKYGLMAYTKISNYDEEAQDVEILNNEEAEVNVIAKEKVTSKMNMAVLNNYANELNNVEIIGNIPTGEGFETTLASEIKAISGNIEVYYSENANAKTEDKTWTTDITNLEKMKSYKIVIKKLEPKEKVELEYSFNLGEGVGYSQKGTASFNVTYVQNGQNKFTKTNINLLSSEEPVKEEPVKEPSSTENNNNVINSTNSTTNTTTNSTTNNTVNNTTNTTTNNTVGNTTNSITNNVENTSNNDTNNITTSGNTVTENPSMSEKPNEPEQKEEIEVKTQVFKAGKELKDSNSVYEGDKLVYKITLTNKAGRDLTNINVTAENSNAVMYELVPIEMIDTSSPLGENEEWNVEKRKIIEHNYEETESSTKTFDKIERLANNESIVLEYEVAVKEVEGAATTKSTIKLTADNMEEETKTSMENKIRQAELKLTAQPLYNVEAKMYENFLWPAKLSIENISDNDITDGIIKIRFSDNLKEYNDMYQTVPWIMYNDS